MNSRELAKCMSKAFGNYCVRKGVSCAPNYFHSNFRCEADLICVDERMMVHEVEVKAVYSDFIQEKYKGSKFKHMENDNLDCNSFSYLVTESIVRKVLRNCDLRFGVFCYKQGDNPRIMCKRKPTIINSRMRNMSVFHAILKKSTTAIWN